MPWVDGEHSESQHLNLKKLRIISEVEIIEYICWGSQKTFTPTYSLQFGHARLWIALEFCKTMPDEMLTFNLHKKEAPNWALLKWRGSLLLPTACSEHPNFPQWSAAFTPRDLAPLHLHFRLTLNFISCSFSWANLELWTWSPTWKWWRRRPADHLGSLRTSHLQAGKSLTSAILPIEPA